jgi:hypothetical protein
LVSDVIRLLIIFSFVIGIASRKVCIRVLPKHPTGGDTGPRWWLGLSGVISILAGTVAFAYTGMTALVLLMIIAVWAIIIGALQL